MVKNNASKSGLIWGFCFKEYQIDGNEKRELLFCEWGNRDKSCHIETPFIEYIEGEITVARNKDKLLSFVNELNIVKCYMYGDFLTKFVFDNANIKFKEISNSQVKYLGGLGEYGCNKFLTEKNIHLERWRRLRK